MPVGYTFSLHGLTLRFASQIREKKCIFAKKKINKCKVQTMNTVKF
jgi:hypothetical protein